MPTAFDIAFAIFFAVVVALIEALYFDKRFKAQVAAGVPLARRNAYRRAAVGQWALAAMAIALWARSARPWAQLGMVPPYDWRLAVGLVVLAVVGVFTVRQIRAVRRLTAENRQTLRGRLAEVEFILPHTRAEYHWFIALSCTAGFCEELLYRGFLTWLVAVYVGLPAAIVVVAIGFGFAHAYQGGRGVLKTGAVSLVMSLIVVASGWLIPAMVVHALIDLGSGVLGFTVLSTEAGPSVRAAA